MGDRAIEHVEHEPAHVPERSRFRTGSQRWDAFLCTCPFDTETLSPPRPGPLSLSLGLVIST